MDDKKKMSAFSIRLPEELHEEIRKLADKDGRSVNNMIVKILTDYVKGAHK